MYKKIKSINKKSLILGVISSLIFITIAIIFAKIPFLKGFTYETSFLLNIFLVLFIPLIYYLNSSFILGGVNLLLFFLFHYIFSSFLCQPIEGVLYFIIFVGSGYFFLISFIKFLIKIEKKTIVLSKDNNLNKTKKEKTDYNLKLTKSSIIKYFITIILILIPSIWSLYSEPQIFIYNIFWGYFHGSLYDTSISITPQLWWLFVWRVVLSIYFISYKKNLILSYISLLISLLIWIFSSQIGLTTDADIIAKKLGGVYKTENFTIYYSKDIAKINKNIELLSKEHEFHFMELTKLLKIESPKKLKSYIFKNSQQKKELMGAGNTLIAKPWQNSIYLNYSDFPHPHLRHELVHALASNFSKSPLKLASKNGWWPEIGIVEGLAVAFETPNDELTPLEKTKTLYEKKMLPNLESIVNPAGFWGKNSYYSYQIMGSFIMFLYQKYGVEKLKELNYSANFEKTYDKSLKELSNEWIDYIKILKIPDRFTEKIKEDFSKPPIFKKICPHTIEKLKGNALKEFYNENYGKSDEIIKNILNFEKGNYSNLFFGYKLFALKNEKIADFYKKSLLSFNIPKYMKNDILESDGDIYFKNGIYEKSEEIYSNLLSEEKAEHKIRSLYIKKIASKNRYLIDLALDLFINNSFDKEFVYYFKANKINQKSDFSINSELKDYIEAKTIASYLFGIRYSNKKDYKQSEYFFTIFDAPDNIYLKKEYLKRLIEIYFHLKDLDKLKNIANQLLPFYDTDGAKKQIEFYIRFLEYLKK